MGLTSLNGSYTGHSHIWQTLNPILWVNSSLLLTIKPSQNLSGISMFPWLSHVKPPIVGVTWNSARRHVRHAFFEDGRTEPGAVDADASSAGVREHGLRLCRGTWNDDPGSDSLMACRMVPVEFAWTETPKKSGWNLWLFGRYNELVLRVYQPTNITAGAPPCGVISP